MFRSSSGHIATRWAAGLALSGAAGFFATVVEETLRPYFAAHHPHLHWIDVVLLIIKNTGSVTTQLVLPYAFLMFALYSYDSISNAVKKPIALLATIPVVLTILLSLPLYPMVVFNYTYVTLWVGPYMLTAAGLLFAAYYKEKNPTMRLDKLFAFCTASIPMLFDLYTGFIARILGDYDAFRMNLYMIILLFISYIYLTIKYGFLGLKINLVQRRMDKSLQVAHDMSAMYNHTIKNELAKLVFYLSKMEVAEKSEKDLHSIKQAVSQITHMSAQIQKQSRRIQLQPDFFSLQQVVEQALCSVIPTLQKKQIEVTTSYLAPDTLYCDMIHTVEVLENLLNNACEAMEPGGKIAIRVVESKKDLVISVRDNGPGIAEDVQAEIFQPFYSTKANSQNYGLGLSYCYQVMQQHKGKIEVFSDGKSGTTFFLQFPKRKPKVKKQTV
jgi:signal transduction histidine kinase